MNTLEETPAPAPKIPDIKGDGPSPVFQIALGLVILAAITFILNYFGAIHLWGHRNVEVPADHTFFVSQRFIDSIRTERFAAGVQDKEELDVEYEHGLEDSIKNLNTSLANASQSSHLTDSLTKVNAILEDSILTLNKMLASAESKIPSKKITGNEVVIEIGRQATRDSVATANKAVQQSTVTVKEKMANAAKVDAATNEAKKGAIKPAPQQSVQKTQPPVAKKSRWN